MTALFRFVEVRCDCSDHPYSFTLVAGEACLLQLADKAEKDAMIELAVGAMPCAEGRIEIAQGDRRHSKAGAAVAGNFAERRRHNEPVPTIWQPLQESRAGRVGWVAANGGLISNLKVWENVTLPLWYHAQRDPIETERSVMHWLGVLGLQVEEFAAFMAAPPYSLDSRQRKLAGLLRALVQMPRVLVVDAVLFEDIKTPVAQAWMAALEAYAAQGRAVLVMADKAMTLPWRKIE